MAILVYKKGEVKKITPKELPQALEQGWFKDREESLKPPKTETKKSTSKAKTSKED